jgi:Beta-lactamase class A
MKYANLTAINLITKTQKVINMKKLFFLGGILFFFSVTSIFAQTDSLRKKIEQIVSSKNADVGIAVYSFDNGDTLSVNGSRHFPMQSVFKFHLALAVLAKVDEGKLALDQKIFIKKSDLEPNTWSPIQKKYPEGNIELSLSEILSYTVSMSDNNGCDILFNLIGGTKEVNDYIHNLGVNDVAVKATEAEMRKDWNVQFTNWSTPVSAVQLLKKFYQREFLSQKSYDFLWKIMAETSTGVKRIKGSLPEGTLVAHKTGSSGKNELGISAAVNDIGIVELPSGKHFAISAFVSNSTEDDSVNEKIIADITKVIWDYFTLHN